MAMWCEIQGEFYIEDAPSIEVLTEACQLLDAAEAMAARIKLDGLTVPGSTPGSLRSHPLLKDMLGARALVVRTLARLGVLHEEIQPVGRGRGRRRKGWMGDAD